MIMRITWGKLRAGSWQEYEQAYRATVAGKEVPGLRGRWLAQDVNDPDGGFAVSVWEWIGSYGSCGHSQTPRSAGGTGPE